MKELEEVLLIAQQNSEEEMSKHEDEIRLLKESQNAQLTRMKNGGRTPVSLSPRPPSAPFDVRTPRLDQTTSGEGIPLVEVVQAELLEKRVKALEKLLRDADMEMEQVLARMNRTQLDVAQLQTDRYVEPLISMISHTNPSHRDDALRQTSQLQTEIEAERDTLKGLMTV
jgi:hypothetical protein